MRRTSNATDAITNIVNKFLSNRVVTTGIYEVLASLLSSCNALYVQLLAASSLPLINNSGWNRLRHSPVRISSMGCGGQIFKEFQPCSPCIDRTTYRRIEIDEEGPGDVFAVAGLGKEGFERTPLVEAVRGSRVHATVGFQSMFKKVP